MITVSNIKVLKEIVSALLESEYNLKIECIYDEFFAKEIDHYEITLLEKSDTL